MYVHICICQLTRGVSIASTGALAEGVWRKEARCHSLYLTHTHKKETHICIYMYI